MLYLTSTRRLENKENFINKVTFNKSLRFRSLFAFMLDKRCRKNRANLNSSQRRNSFTNFNATNKLLQIPKEC